MSVELEADQRRFVSELVRSGRYDSESAVLRDGVRLMQEREAERAAFNAKIMAGLADVEAGRTRDMDEVFDELEAYFQAKVDAEDAR